MQEKFLGLLFHNYNLSKRFNFVLDWRQLRCVLILQRHESKIDKYLIGYDNQKDHDFYDDDSKGRRKTHWKCQYSIIVQYVPNYEIKKKQLLAKRRIKKGKLLGGGKNPVFISKCQKSDETFLNPSLNERGKFWLKPIKNPKGCSSSYNCRFSKGFFDDDLTKITPSAGG